MLERGEGAHSPAICTPLVGKDRKELLTELAEILLKKPDIIEWRLDFYEEIQDINSVLSAAKDIYENSERTPILLTVRSQKEGGQPISLSEKEVVAILAEVCKHPYVAIIDFEVSNQPEHIRYLRKVSKGNNKKLVLSYHNFSFTPPKAEIFKSLFLAEFYGADAAKAAVMPQNNQDVLTLLEATREAEKELTIPLITMSMGGLGAISRIVGWMYGSSVTFAVGKSSSAPGQVPIDELRKIIQLTKKVTGPESHYSHKIVSV